MKISYKITAVLAGAALLLSSCAVDGVYGSVGVARPYYSASVAWSNASYDANGFPIFGYTNGQPVYGYTAAGAAVLSFAALTALCFVPQWGPAPWYHGPWHYPPRIRRVPAPPHCPPGHMPHMRPHGGLNAPIHRNPNLVLRPSHGSHGPAWADKPNGMGKPGRHNHSSVNMPHPGRPNHGFGNVSRPGRANHGPVNASRPGRPNHGLGNVSRPGRPNHGLGNVSQPGRPNHGLGNVSRPGRPSHGLGNVSQPGRPNHGLGNVSRPGRPNHGFGNMSRPGGFSHGAGGMSRPGGASRLSGGGHPGHGGHRR